MLIKISILIPAYNRPHYLIEALVSVLNQTVQPYEIIIADDNTKNREKNFQALLPYLKKSPHIKFVQNIQNLGGVGNYKNLFCLASGDYIKFLAEDDILYPKNLEILSAYLDKDEKITVATSKRDVIDEETNEKIEIFAAKQLYEQDSIVDGKEVIQESLKYLKNFVGEFSTYMFRKKDVDFTLFECCGYTFDTNADWFLWMMLASKGKVAYHAKPLSCFRYGKSNDQLSPYHIVQGFKECVWFISDKFLSYLQITLANKFVSYERLLDLLKRLMQVEYIQNDKNKKEELLQLLVEAIKNELAKCEQDSNRSFSVSVIVVTYNNADTIYECLQSLLCYLSDEDEIVLVDNRSSDDTIQIIKSFNDKRIKLIRSQINLGYAKGINKGIEAATKEFYIFLNPDTVVTKGFVQKLISPLQKKVYALSSPLSTYVAGFQKLSTYSHIVNFMNFFSYDEISEYLSCLYKKSPYQESKLLIGFCLAVRKDIIEAIGGLDEDLFLGNDDLEFSWRLQLRGYKQAIVKNCFIYHKGHESFQKSGSVAEKMVEESTNILAKKLIDYYGYGNVPQPEELWNITWFAPTNPEYAFMFLWSDKKIDFKTIDEKLKNHKYSVVIILVNYKNWSDTQKCVDSLKNLYYKNYKIIIVDNSEENIEKLRELYGNEYEIINENENIFNFSKPIVITTKNFGFAHANNITIKKIKDRFDYIWILNNDTIVEPKTLSHLLETSLKLNNPLVTCKIKDYTQKEKVQYDGNVPTYSPKNDYPDKIKYASFLSGANILLRSSIFDEIGLWDESYFLYYEDNDFSIRLQKAGYRLVYTPYTCIYHKGGATIGKWKESPLSLYYAIRNRALFSKKHFQTIDDSYIEEIVQTFITNKVNKLLLKTLFTAIVDSFACEIGKTFDEEFMRNYSKKEEKILWQKYQDLIDERLMFLYVSCMNKPRDTKKFMELIDYVRTNKEKIYASFCSDNS